MANEDIVDKGEDMGKKKCPFCGEEILAAAKKCKHCGEWLEETINTNTITTTSHSITLFNYTWLANACWVAMLFSVISVIQSMEIENFRGGGVFKLFFIIASLMPEWLIIICEGALYVYLLLGLRQYVIANNKSKGIPFVTYIILYIGSCFFSLILSFMNIDGLDGLDEDESLGIAVLLGLIAISAIPFLIASLIVEFILGLKLTDKLKETSKVGIILMVGGVASILLNIISLGMTGDIQGWVFLGMGVFSLALYYYLRKFFAELKNRKKKEAENP